MKVLCPDDPNAKHYMNMMYWNDRIVPRQSWIQKWYLILYVGRIFINGDDDIVAFDDLEYEIWCFKNWYNLSNSRS
jgi:hypothetical protein